MSLINEALRKARQAASEHDRSHRGPFQPARAYPRDAPGASGLLAIVDPDCDRCRSWSAPPAAWWLLGTGADGAPIRQKCLQWPTGGSAPAALDSPDRRRGPTVDRRQADLG